MIVLGNKYLFIFKIIFSYSPNGVQNIIKSKPKNDNEEGLGTIIKNDPVEIETSYDVDFL